LSGVAGCRRMRPAKGEKRGKGLHTGRVGCFYPEKWLKLLSRWACSLVRCQDAISV
jgi:hypothetical protein